MSVEPESVGLSPEYAQRRFGQFKIIDDLIKCHSSDLRKLFGEIIVTRCEHNFQGYFDYTGLSLLFDPVPDQLSVPEYTIEATKLGDGSLSFGAKKLQ